MGKKKLRVVLDTNVILSSLLFGGRLAFIHKAWKRGETYASLFGRHP